MVVISIIIVLGGLLFPAIHTIKDQANKARAAAAISSLCAASSGYYNDYGRWPDVTSPSELVMVFNGAMNPLTGAEDSNGKEQNPRKIPYMEFKLKDLTAKSGSGGDSTSEVQFYDPWGIPYAFCFDNGKAGYVYGNTSWKDSTAYDNTIPKPVVNDGTPGLTINVGFAFFSNGPDQNTGSGPSDPKNQSSQVKAYEDDVRSWK